MGDNNIVGGEEEEIMEEIQKWRASTSSNQKVPLLSLNHVSFLCKSLSTTIKFYEDVLGFVLIKRPSSFNFQGAWLFNYGIGIHLLESESDGVLPTTNESEINPKDNHISFECSDMGLIVERLEEKNIEYVTAIVEEGGIQVDQLFFHDPNGYMVEICNCQNLPVLPLSSSCPLNNQTPSSFQDENARQRSLEQECSKEVEVLMMENFLNIMMNISI